MSEDSRAAWQLPPGVSRGTWDYLNNRSIATDYDSYFAEHPLLRLDLQVLGENLPSEANSLVADFGCGTARVARALAPLGYRVLNVDLSRHMLEAAASVPNDRTAAVHANLVQLEWLRDACLDAAVCLFSSIGMIRGNANRLQFLKHAHRALKPNSKLMLHVHNRYHSLFDPHGKTWLLTSWLRSLRDREYEFGDRTYHYRGLPAMYLHIFSYREIRRLLIDSGFNKLQFLPINCTASELLPATTKLSTLRAGGFFVIATT